MKNRLRPRFRCALQVESWFSKQPCWSVGAKPEASPGILKMKERVAPQRLLLDKGLLKLYSFTMLLTLLHSQEGKEVLVIFNQKAQQSLLLFLCASSFLESDLNACRPALVRLLNTRASELAP